MSNEYLTVINLPVVVHLERWEYDHASHVGIQRMLQREGSADRGYYDNSRKQNELNASIASAVCECAVAKLFNRYWHAGYWHVSEHQRHANTADVGKTIEVRRVRRQTNPVAINQTDAEKFIVAVFAHEPDYRSAEILGCISGQDGWQVSEAADYDPSGKRRVIPIDKLNKEIRV